MQWHCGGEEEQGQQQDKRNFRKSWRVLAAPRWLGLPQQRGKSEKQCGLISHEVVSQATVGKKSGHQAAAAHTVQLAENLQSSAKKSKKRQKLASSIGNWESAAV